jgi:RNA recognition motif-containing protein
MKLFVGNLSFEMTDAELRTHFAEFGRVESAEIFTTARRASRADLDSSGWPRMRRARTLSQV